MGLPSGYDRKCVSLSADESDVKAASQPFVVRFKVYDPYPPFFDMVHCRTGRMITPRANLKEQDVFNDPILLKSDGHATYHFANVVDDHLMKITHVIRGSEWLTSTPLHAALYKAFGWELPIFCHVPLIVDTSGQKLSKRDKASNLATYEGPRGVYPEVLLNFVALLGWSHTERHDEMTLKQMEQLFLPKFTKGDVTLTFEKLYYLQNLQIQRIINEPSTYRQEFQSLLDDVQRQVHHWFPKLEVSEEALPHMISSLVRAENKRFWKNRSVASIVPLSEDFVVRNAFFFTPLPSDLPRYEPLKTARPISDIHTAVLVLCQIPESAWDADTIHATLCAYAPPPETPDTSASDSLTARPEQILKLEPELEQKLDHLRTASGSSITRFEQNLELERDRLRELKRSIRTTSDSTMARFEEILEFELHRLRSFRSEINHWLRWALLAGWSGPNIPTTMKLLGRERCRQRIENALALSKSREASKDLPGTFKKEVRLRIGRDRV